jgi:predicted DNA-binding transcriptional regulator YafY
MTARLRHDAILRLLRRSGSSTVTELAGTVGVSRRTLLRDIGALRDQGYLIHTECGRGGGVQLDPGAMQGTARISVTEVFALLISVASMRAARALPFAGLADAGLAKIERTLPAEKVRDLRRLLACLHVGTLSPLQDLSDMGAMEAGLLPCFETAFLQQLCLRFRYRDGKGVETQREVEPQAMLILPPLWYLVAWDPSRGDFRYFRMDRISGPELVEGKPFRRRHVPFGADVCPYAELERKLAGRQKRGAGFG